MAQKKREMKDHAFKRVTEPKEYMALKLYEKSEKAYRKDYPETSLNVYSEQIRFIKQDIEEKRYSIYRDSIFQVEFRRKFGFAYADIFLLDGTHVWGECADKSIIKILNGITIIEKKYGFSPHAEKWKAFSSKEMKDIKESFENLGLD